MSNKNRLSKNFRKTVIAVALSSFCIGAMACTYNATYTSAAGTISSGNCIATINQNGMSDLTGSINFTGGTLNITSQSTADAALAGIYVNAGNSITLGNPSSSTNPREIIITATGRTTGNGTFSTYGAQVNSGVLTLNNASLSATGNSSANSNGGNAYGVYSQSTSGSNLKNVTVAAVGGTTTLAGANVGGKAYGIDAKGSSIILSGTNTISATGGTGTGDCTTNCGLSYGLYAEAGGLIDASTSTLVTINNVAATVPGSKNWYQNGILATGANTSNVASTIKLSAINLTTAGNSSIGLQSKNNGLITVSGNANITTSGNSAYGVFIDRGTDNAAIANSNIVFNGSSNKINTSGTSAHAWYVNGDSAAASSINNVTISATGASSDGLYFYGDKIGIHTITITGSSISSTLANAIENAASVSGSTRNINLSGSALSGNAVADTTGILNLNLDNTSSLTGGITGAKQVALKDAGSNWTLTKNSSLASLNNLGTLNLSGYTLTATGAVTFGASSNVLVSLNSSSPSTIPITAQTAVIGGTLNIGGSTISNVVPSKASEIVANSYTIIHTTNGITGSFTNQAQTQTSDYLISGAGIFGNDYVLSGFQLSWKSGGQAWGTGNFTVAPSRAFEVDVALANQTVPGGGFTSGWNGIDLTKLGTGTLILSGANTYTGKTTVQAGTLKTGATTDVLKNSSDLIVNGGVFSLNGAAQIVNRLSGTGGTVDLNGYALSVNEATAGDSTAYAGAISDASNGSGILNKIGAGNLTLSGDLTYTGATNIQDGTLTLDGTSGGGLLSSSVLNSTASTGKSALLKIRNGASFTGKTTSTGATGIQATVNASSTLSLSGGNSFLDSLSNSGKLYIAGGSALNVANAITFSSTSDVEFTLDPSNPTINASSAVLDGTLTVNGFSGNGATPSKASLITGVDHTIIHTTGGITGAFTNQGINQTTADYLVSGAAISGNDYKLLNVKLAWNANDGVEPAYAPYGTGNFTLADGVSFEVDKPLDDRLGTYNSGWDGKSLVKKGDGTLIISALASYSGSTTLEKGILQLDGFNVLGSSKQFFINAGTLQLAGGFNQTLNKVAGASGSIIDLGSDPALTLSLTNNILGTDDTVFDGIIQGSGSLKIIGAGVLALNEANTYTGLTEVYGGTLNIGAANSLSNSSGIIIKVGSQLLLNGHTQTLNKLSGPGGLLDLGDANITVNNNVAGVDDTIFTGLIKGTSASLITKTGKGKLTLNGGNATVGDSTFGNIMVKEGELYLAIEPIILTGNNYTTVSGATTNIASNSGLHIDNAIFAQNPGSHLIITTGLSPTINSDSAIIAGDLTLKGFDDGFTLGDDTPFNASSAAGATPQVLIHTQAGINGTFDNVIIDPTSNLISTSKDYVLHDIYISADGKDYDVGFHLAWNTGGKALGTGTFTVIDKPTIFTQDVALADQTVPTGGFDSGWDGKSLVKEGSGTLILSKVNSYSGKTTTNAGILQMGIVNSINSSSDIIINGGTLDLAGFGQTAQRLSGTGGAITLGSAKLTANNELAGTDDSSYAGKITGTGDLIKTGAGVLNLTGTGSLVGNVTVNGGTLSLNQAAPFTTSAAYTTASGATTKVDTNASLNIGSSFTQAANSTLEINAGINPTITAATASLNGDLVVSGFSDGFNGGNLPLLASTIANKNITLIHTTGGITGDFANTSFNPAVLSTNADYLLHDNYISGDGKDYDVGFRLAWTDGGKTKGTGDFTISGTTPFEMDIALADQTVPTGGFTLGWSGKDLDKKGSGTLILSKVNSYSGKTTTEAGTLKMGIADSINSSSDIIVNGGTLDLAGLSQTAQRLSGTGGAITLGSATLTANNQVLGTDDSSYAGKITGTGDLIKTGAGVLSLSGTGSSVGNVTVSGGTLSLNQAAPFTTSAAYSTASGATTKVDINASLDIGSSFTQEASSTLGIVVGSGIPVSAQSASLNGNLNLSGFNDGFTGTNLPISASSSLIKNYTAIHTTNGITGDFVNVSNNAAAIISTGLDYLLHDARVSADSKDYVIGFHLAWDNGGQKDGTGDFTIVNGAFNADTILADQTAPTAGFDSGWSGKDLVKLGSGTLALSALNTYSGTTTVSGGTLQTGLANTLDTSSQIIVDTAGTLDLNSYNQKIKGIAGSGIVNLGGGATLDVDNSSSNTFSGVIKGDGNLTKSNSGSLVLAGANTFSGALRVQAGTLQAGIADTISTASDVIISSGATLDLNNFNQTANRLTGDGAVTLSSAKLSLNNAVLGTDDRTFTGTINGDPISTLAKTGKGAEHLTNVNSSVGNIEVDAGELAFEQAGNFNVTGTGSSYITKDNATTTTGKNNSQLNITGSFEQQALSTLNIIIGAQPSITADTAKLDGTLNILGFSSSSGAPIKSSQIGNGFNLIHTNSGITGDFSSITSNPPIVAAGMDYLLHDARVSANTKDYDIAFQMAWNDGGAKNGTGNFTMATGTAFEVDTLLENQTIPAGGFVSGWNGKDLDKKGDGTLTLSYANTYDGKTTIDGGTLQMGKVDAVKSSSDVIVNGGIFKLDTFNQTVKRLSGTAAGVVSLGSANLTANNETAGTDDSVFAGSINGSGGLIKTGAGKLTLTGSSAYSGGTQIDAGAIALSGSAAQLNSNVKGSNSGDLIISNSAGLNGTIDSIDKLNITDATSKWSAPASAANLTIGEVNSSGAIDLSNNKLSSNKFDLGATSSLTVTFDPNNSTAITSKEASLAGQLTVNGFSGGNTAPAKASDIIGKTFVLIHTTGGGITGGFSNMGSTQVPDYLLSSVGIDGSDYILPNVKLSWTSGSINKSNGNFTLLGNSTFDVDIPLVDESGAFTTGWDGKDLTKLGTGTLILSVKNPYDGITKIEDGTLQTGTEDAIAASSDVIINGGILDLNTHNQSIKRLSGSGGVIKLGAAKLTVDNHDATIDDSSFAGEINGTGNLIKTGQGTLTLTGQTKWTGETDINGGTLVLDGSSGGAQLVSNIVGGSSSGSALILKNGAQLTGGIDPLDVNIAANSTWNMNTSTSQTNNLNLAGTINYVLVPGGVGKTIEVLGDFVGNNGLINMNTELAGDNSLTDKMIIRGNSSGTARVAVNNVGGAGAQTVNGIKIIEVNGASNAQFTLQGRAVAGAYEYSLYQGTSTTADGNWYLRSLNLTPAPAPTPAPSPSPAPAPAPIKVLRPEVGAYLANQNMDNSLFTHTLHERLGETMYSSDLCGCSNLNGSIWTRVRANEQASEAGDGRLDISGNSQIIEVGSDLIKWKGETRFMGGVMFSAGKGSSDVSSRGTNAKAQGDVTGYSVGLYAVWYGAGNHRNEGPYLDSYVQYGYFNNKVKGDQLAEQKYNSHNWQASIEAGYSLALSSNPQNLWYFEPQAQIIYSNYHQNDVHENNGTNVTEGNPENVSTRIGARLYARQHLDNGMKVKPFIELNWLHDVNGAEVTMGTNTLGNISTLSDLAVNKGEAKLGAEIELSKKWNAWGDVGYQQGSHGYRQTSGNIGVKYLW